MSLNDIGIAAREQVEELDQGCAIMQSDCTRIVLCIYVYEADCHHSQTPCAHLAHLCPEYTSSAARCCLVLSKHPQVKLDSAGQLAKRFLSVCKS